MTTIYDAEQRHFSRVPFHIDAHLSGPAGTVAARVVDLSLKGALVEQPAAWPSLQAGTVLELEIRLDASGETRIHMQTEVAHGDGARLGLHCVHIDLDSATALRRLVAVNLGDASALDRELIALG